jgi:membrane-associated protein
MLFLSIDLATLIKIIGTLGVGVIVFAESGLLIGFFLPGDSLLFTAGFLASGGFLDIIPLLIVSFLAAILGDSVGYSLGYRYGRKVFYKKNGYFFNKKRVIEAELFFEKHGAYAIILARFTPIVRTITPILAGVGKMPYRLFLTYNVVGGFIWGVGITSLGYFFGNLIPNADQYILPIVLGILITSFIPPFIKILRERKKQ